MFPYEHCSPPFCIPLSHLLNSEMWTNGVCQLQCCSWEQPLGTGQRNKQNDPVSSPCCRAEVLMLLGLHVYLETIQWKWSKLLPCLYFGSLYYSALAHILKESCYLDMGYCHNKTENIWQWLSDLVADSVDTDSEGWKAGDWPLVVKPTASLLWVVEDKIVIQSLLQESPHDGS